MRSTDFSLAPPQGRAGAMVVTERSFGRGADARHGRASRRALAAHLAAAPGFLWQKSYRRSGGTIGIASYFRERSELDAAVASATAASTSASESASAELEPWLKFDGVDPSGRILQAEPSGYTNGLWRAEDGAMAHIEHFTPTSVEADRGSLPPRVSAASTARPSLPMRSTGRARPFQPISDAGAMFVGATKYTGPLALIALSRIYYPMIRRMVTMRGYVWFTTYYEFPFTLGTLAFFESRDDLLAFARMPGHRHLMQWITKDTRNGTAGYIRLHVAPTEDSAR